MNSFRRETSLEIVEFVFKDSAYRLKNDIEQPSKEKIWEELGNVRKKSSKKLTSKRFARSLYSGWRGSCKSFARASVRKSK